MPIIEVVCWANSRKYGGRCVAGIRTDGGGWVRPVAPTRDGSLLSHQYKVQDGTDAQVADLVRMDLSEPRPEPHQPENWLVGRRQWQLVARPAARDLRLSLLRSHLVTGPDLLGSESDRVPFSSFRAKPAEASLAMVVPSRIEWDVRVPAPGKRHTRAVFRLGDTEYNLAITDVAWEYRLLGLPPGRHPAHAAGLQIDDRVLFTVSLGEPYEVDGCCYKLVAAVVILSASFAHDLTSQW